MNETDCPHVRWTTTCDDCGETLAVAPTDEPLSDSTCHDCGMTHADGYHPHLHCIIWRAYRRRPTDVLTEHGYVRSLAGFTDDK